MNKTNESPHKSAQYKEPPATGAGTLPDIHSLSDQALPPPDAAARSDTIDVRPERNPDVARRGVLFYRRLSAG